MKIDVYMIFHKILLFRSSVSLLSLPISSVLYQEWYVRMSFYLHASVSMSACISCSILLYKGGCCVICSIDIHNCYILFETYRFLALENVLYLIHFRWNSTLPGIKVTITMFFISFNLVCLCPFIFSLSLFLVCCCI